MRFTTLGSDRVLHEGAGYRRKDYKLPNYPKSFRENLSGVKLKSEDVIYIPMTAKWAAKEDKY